jgi:hypothetical protein
LPLPAKLWRCPFCGSDFVERWRLKRHLMLSHKIRERRAWTIADNSEYWLRVRMEYVNPRELEFEEEEEL